MSKSRIEQIEQRFKNVTGLTHLDLSTPNFERGANQQQATTKDEYKNFGYVTTPLWLVDEMLESNIPAIRPTSRTCDACAGCGQFSIRLMRKLHDKFVELGASETKVNDWITKVWLPKRHFFTEFQFSNVAKLVYIFGTDINVYVGDTLDMTYTTDADTGLLFFNNNKKKWSNIPKLKDLIIPRKDDLNFLISLFTALETKLQNRKSAAQCSPSTT